MIRACLFSLLFFAASPALASPAAPAVDTALTEWVEAVQSRSLDNIMRLYDKDAIMISTFAQHPLTTRAQLKEYFTKVIANPDVVVDVTESHPRMFGDMAVNTGQYTLSYTQEGEPEEIPARFSFTYVLRGGKWIIVDQHSSRVPLPGKKK